MIPSVSKSALQAASLHARSLLCTSARSLSAETASPEATSSSTIPPKQLSPEQVRGIANALQQLQAPLGLATRVAKLTAMSALYRDIHLVASSIHQRQALGIPNPLADHAPAANAPKPKPSISHYPWNDTSTAPDTDAPVYKLDQRYMDKITCWAALQPSHIETSHMLMTGIHLFPPQEAAYPTYVDFDAVVKGLEKTKSRKRLRFWRKMQKRQDKYQLKLWDHYSGHL